MATLFNGQEPVFTNRQVYAVPRKALGILDVLVFGVGLSSVFYIEAGGNLYLAEIFLLGLLPFLIITRSHLFRLSYFKIIIFFGVGWLINQMFTDVYRGTSTADIIKGWALIGVFLTNFLALYLLVFPSPHRIAIGLLGFAIGTALQPVLQPTANMLIDPWKFGMGPAVILLVTVLAALWDGTNSRKLKWWSIILIVIAMYCFYIRSRSTGAIALLTALCIWFRFTGVGQTLALRLKNPGTLIVSCILLLTIILGIIQAYGYAAEQGYLGDSARNAYKQQSSGKYGILLGGRMEWMPATHAIFDSPIIGYGSYARDDTYNQYIYELIDLGYGLDNYQIQEYYRTNRDTIPTHSHFLQGWVWAGLAGAIFWLIIFGLIIRAMIMAFRRPTVLFCTTMFFGFSSLWNILFSPLSNIGRLQWAFVLVTILFTLAYKPIDKDVREVHETLWKAL